MRTKILVFIILALATGFFWNWYLYTKPLVLDISQTEAQYIMAELRARRAGNCMVVRTDYGFRAESLETGAVYKVKK